MFRLAWKKWALVFSGTALGLPLLAFAAGLCLPARNHAISKGTFPPELAEKVWSAATVCLHHPEGDHVHELTPQTCDSGLPKGIYRLSYERGVIEGTFRVNAHLDGSGRYALLVTEDVELLFPIHRLLAALGASHDRVDGFLKAVGGELGVDVEIEHREPWSGCGYRPF